MEPHFKKKKKINVAVAPSKTPSDLWRHSRSPRNALLGPSETATDYHDGTLKSKTARIYSDREGGEGEAKKSISLDLSSRGVGICSNMQQILRMTITDKHTKTWE